MGYGVGWSQYGLKFSTIRMRRVGHSRIGVRATIRIQFLIMVGSVS